MNYNWKILRARAQLILDKEWFYKQDKLTQMRVIDNLAYAMSEFARELRETTFGMGAECAIIRKFIDKEIFSKLEGVC